jgi:hypothetical protein
MTLNLLQLLYSLFSTFVCKGGDGVGRSGHDDHPWTRDDA